MQLTMFDAIAPGLLRQSGRNVNLFRLVLKKLTMNPLQPRHDHELAEQTKTEVTDASKQSH